MSLHACTFFHQGSTHARCASMRTHFFTIGEAHENDERQSFYFMKLPRDYGLLKDPFSSALVLFEHCRGSQTLVLFKAS